MFLYSSSPFTEGTAEELTARTNKARHTFVTELEMWTLNGFSSRPLSTCRPRFSNCALPDTCRVRPHTHRRRHSFPLLPLSIISSNSHLGSDGWVTVHGPPSRAYIRSMSWNALIMRCSYSIVGFHCRIRILNAEDEGRIFMQYN